MGNTELAKANEALTALILSVTVVVLGLATVVLRQEASVYPLSSIYLVIGYGLLFLNCTAIIGKNSHEKGLYSIQLGLIALPPIANFLGADFMVYASALGYCLFPITALQAIRSFSPITIFSAVVAGFIIGAYLLFVQLQADGFVYSTISDRYFDRGIITGDNIYHRAIANMISSYGSVTTGIDGLEHARYHIGSHYLLGSFGNFFNSNADFAYNVAYPVFVCPLVIYLFLKVALSFYYLKSRLYSLLKAQDILIFLFLLFSIISDWAAKEGNKDLFYLDSESYGISMILLYMYIRLAIMYCKNSISTLGNASFLLISVVFITIITVTKISTGFVFSFAFCYLLLRINSNKSLFRISIYVFVALATFYIAYYFSNPQEHKVIWVPTRFLHLHTSWSENYMLPQAGYYFLILAFWSLLYIWYRLKEHPDIGVQHYYRSKATYLIDVELLLFATGLSFVVVSFIYIVADGERAFTLPVRQVGMAAFLSLTVYYREQIARTVKSYFQPLSVKSILVIFVISMVSMGFAYRLYTLAKNAYEDVSAIDKLPSGSPFFESESSKFLITHLRELEKLSVKEKKQLAINIPQEEEQFWNPNFSLIPKAFYSFIVPALSGIMQVDGVPHYTTRSQWYGFSSFRSRTSATDTLTYPQMAARARSFVPEVEELLVIRPSVQTVTRYNIDSLLNQTSPEQSLPDTPAL